MAFKIYQLALGRNGMRQDSKKVAEAMRRRLAIEALQAMVALATSEKATPEMLQAARRARQNARLIKELGV
jgi:hypothetical protein